VVEEVLVEVHAVEAGEVHAVEGVVEAGEVPAADMAVVVMVASASLV
jgi:hypothetical protein